MINNRIWKDASPCKSWSFLSPMCWEQRAHRFGFRVLWKQITRHPKVCHVPTWYYSQKNKWGQIRFWEKGTKVASSLAHVHRGTWGASSVSWAPKMSTAMTQRKWRNIRGLMVLTKGHCQQRHCGQKESETMLGMQMSAADGGGTDASFQKSNSGQNGQETVQTMYPFPKFNLKMWWWNPNSLKYKCNTREGRWKLIMLDTKNDIDITELCSVYLRMTD